MNERQRSQRGIWGINHRRNYTRLAKCRFEQAIKVRRNDDPDVPLGNKSGNGSVRLGGQPQTKFALFRRGFDVTADDLAAFSGGLGKTFK